MLEQSVAATILEIYKLIVVVLIMQEEFVEKIQEIYHMFLILEQLMETRTNGSMAEYVVKIKVVLGMDII